VHSLHNEAVAAQLKGDILYTFHDDNAAHSYQKAAQLYEQSNKFLQAITAYEKIRELAPRDISASMQLIKLYNLLGWYKKMYTIAWHIFDVLAQEKRYIRIQEMISDISRDLIVQAPLYEAFTTILLRDSGVEQSLVTMTIKKTIDGYLVDDDTQLTRFLATLSASDEAMYAYACDYIESYTSS
jgi:tetratricopeptide (TPR) repeat protein